MNFGDFKITTSFGNMWDYGSGSASGVGRPRQCKKSTFVTGTINAIPNGTATITGKAQSFCDCGVSRTSSCKNKGYSTPKRVCRTTYPQGPQGLPVEECVNVFLGKSIAALNSGLPSEFCIESIPYPEDMGTCPRPPHKVSCKCESDGVETFTDSLLSSSLGQAEGSLLNYLGNGVPRRAMDAADCGSCDD